MTKRILFAGASLIAIMLAAQPASAQAQRRGGGDSAPSPSSGGGSSSGGDSAPAPQPAPQPAVRRAPEGGLPGGASARPRSNPATPGNAGGQSTGGGGGGESAGSRSTGRQPELRYNGARERTTQAYRGAAQARVYIPQDRSPSFGYHYRTPWYFSGNPYGSPYYGYGYGYPYYGRSSWGGYAYGPGYGLFGYDPYGAMYAPLYLGGGYVGGRDDQGDDDRPVGSIRLRAEPRDAKVYVDGALVGTVDDFDGLRNHLDLQPGRHHIELRAEGYENYSTNVSVAEGKTLTTRASMRKK